MVPGGAMLAAATKTPPKHAMVSTAKAPVASHAKPIAKPAAKSASVRKTQNVRAKTPTKPQASASRYARNTRNTRTPVRATGRTTAAASSRPASRSTQKQAVKASVRRATQATPSADRYREIQQAMVEKGYYKGDPNGTWGPDSVDALKRFQKEQKLEPNGKLDAVSLIALGLGPKRNLAARSNPDPNSLPRPQDDNRRSQGSERP